MKFKKNGKAKSYLNTNQLHKNAKYNGLELRNISFIKIFKK